MKGKIIGASIYPHPPIVIEEIGGKRREEARKTIEGIKKVSKLVGKSNPDTIILISPHGPMFKDAISINYEDKLIGDFSRFGNMDLSYSFKNDKNLIDMIVNNSSKKGISTINMTDENMRNYGQPIGLDHGALVPLHFLEEYLDDFKLIVITYALFDSDMLYEFGVSIKEAVEQSGKKVHVLASGDLSHKLKDGGPYNYNPKGKVYDNKIVSLIKDMNIEEIVEFNTDLSDEAGECGLRSFQIMAGALSGQDLKSEVFSYEGPFGVGYMTAYIDVLDKGENDG